MNTEKKTRKMVMTAVMTAIVILMSSVPFLGYIPLGFINATIIHVPVIIGAILLGPRSGAFLGFVFGMTSLIKNTMEPNATSFVFSPFYSVSLFGVDLGNIVGSIIIVLVPRILIGVTAYWVYVGVKKLLKDKPWNAIAYGVAGVAGSLTNTLLVMNLIYLFFGRPYAEATGKAFGTLYAYILAVIVGSGVPEAVVAAILTAAVCKVLVKAAKL